MNIDLGKSTGGGRMQIHLVLTLACHFIFSLRECYNQKKVTTTKKYNYIQQHYNFAFGSAIYGKYHMKSNNDFCENWKIKLIPVKSLELLELKVTC